MAVVRSGSMVYWTPVALRAGSIREDGERLFRARVVAGGDHKVAALAGRLTHLGALGAVAVSSAAEDGDHARSRIRRHLAGERGQVTQRVVGVRVVDDRGEGLAAVDELEAAGNRFEVGNAATRSAKGMPRAWPR